ncbi:MAG TPA: hypothetical protein VMV89_10515 [Candidatus Paceibacterota bacterium]|nr:hypothetical protein [Candidatus Paceibacterota bacterium]
MFYLLLIIIIAYAVFFCRAAEFEDESPWIWGGMSVAVSAVAFFGLGCGWLGISLGQAGLFVGITIFRILRKP